MQLSIVLLQVLAWEKAWGIINGIEVRRGEQPYVAAFSCKKPDEKIIRCGGVIITPRHVLTAAHCFKFCVDKTGRFLVGTVDLKDIDDNDKAQTVNVIKVAIHPYYKVHREDDFPVDLAIATVNEKIVKGRPIAIAEKDAAPGTTALVSGWGVRGANIPRTGILHTTEVKVATFEDCMGSKGDLDLHLEEKLIGSRTTVRGLFQGPNSGDSGGPLVQYQDQASNGSPTLLGIYFRGKNIESSSDPNRCAYYINLRYHRRWIEMVLGNA